MSCELQLQRSLASFLSVFEPPEVHFFLFRFSKHKFLVQFFYWNHFCINFVGSNSSSTSIRFAIGPSSTASTAGSAGTMQKLLKPANTDIGELDAEEKYLSKQQKLKTSMMRDLQKLGFGNGLKIPFISEDLIKLQGKVKLHYTKR
jgi:hypothetical protein